MVSLRFVNNVAGLSHAMIGVYLLQVTKLIAPISYQLKPEQIPSLQGMLSVRSPRFKLLAARFYQSSL